MVTEARARGLPTGLWGLEPEAFGSDERTATVSIDVRPVLDRRLAALRAHRTQLDPGHLLAALPAELAERHLSVEAWRLASAGDGGADALATLLAPHAQAVPAA
jgi:LmbE family N-acetylglucosaminyl deacetylase